jgi:hypothetical protein
MLALEFGMGQRTANEWIHRLREGVNKAFDHGGYIPARDPKQLDPVLESEAASPYGRDGTERSRQRPWNPEKQKHSDSGKKKHTRSRIALLAESIRVKSIIGAKLPRANGMRKGLLMRKILHIPRTLRCRKILDFQGMNRMESRRFNHARSPKGKNVHQNNKSKTASSPVSGLSLHLSVLE